jgi:hypothetical protein
MPSKASRKSKASPRTGTHPRAVTERRTPRRPTAIPGPLSSRSR